MATAGAMARAGRAAEAVAMLRVHLEGHPDDVEAAAALGTLHLSMGQTAEAISLYQWALRLAPDSPNRLTDMGNVLAATGRFTEAVESYRRALAIDPACWQSGIGLTWALCALARGEEAAEAGLKVVELCPHLPDAYEAAARALLLAGRSREAVGVAQRGVVTAPADPRLACTLAVAMTYGAGADQAELTEAYRRAGRAIAAGAPGPPPWPNARQPDRRLRVGYLSPDFREHSVAFFAEPILASHDPAAVEIICYSTGRADDNVTLRFRRHAHRWVDAAGLPWPRLIQRIRADGVDILVELSGHSQGNRLPALAARAAPVQVTYIGWPTTTGLPTMDWRIVDAVTDPNGAERFATERLLRLDGCFLCYRPHDAAPEPAAGPRRRGRPLTFGSFNAMFKVGDDVVAAWAAVLSRRPDARLLIKASGLEMSSVRDRLAARFARHSIAPERLEFCGRTPGVGAHLARYADVDVALDTFPYNGTTTTCEALWMGVPVATLRGGAHAGRVGASLLAAAGRSDWVARSVEGYVQLAVSLAEQAAVQDRVGLRRAVAASPLCDGPAFTRRLEGAYRQMWRDWCAQGRP